MWWWLSWWRKLDHLGIEIPQALNVVVDGQATLSTIQLAVATDTHASIET